MFTKRRSEKMDIYAPRSVGKMLLAIFLGTVAVCLLLVAFMGGLDQSLFSASVLFSLIFFGLSAWAIFSYFENHVILHADEQGILTMYQFYLPWEYVDEIYVKETENGNEFIEIKVFDKEKYVREMDHDAYTAYYDEMEMAMMHGHEIFYFPVTYMDLTGEQVLNFLNTARKKYGK